MAEPDDPNETLLDLLAGWEETRKPGESVTVADLAAVPLELRDQFREQAERLASIDSLLACAGMGVDPLPVIDGFDQLELIGQGGMGEVYKARDTRLDCIVAVKLPVGLYCSARTQEQLEQEGRTLAKLRHPNIVQIRAAGATEFAPYLVMDYVPGGNLGQWVRNPVSPLRVAEALERICRAVSYAHNQGFRHRDLKPSNILLGEHGQPLVSDFGIAAFFADLPDAADPFTGTSTGTVGTTAYTAPEQLQPDRGKFAASADIWSLGVILYELLTGQKPFPNSPLDDPPPAAPRSIRPKIPKGLERIALRCLATNPADRYASAAELADDLARWLRRRAFWRKAKRLGLAALVGLALLAPAVHMAWPDPPEVQHANQLRQIHESLRQGHPVTLLPATGKPLTHRVRLGDANAVRTGTNPDGTFMVDAPCDGPVLIELLDDPKVERYRFTLQVREDECYGDAGVGLYYAHQVVPLAAGPVHLFGRLQFADLGPEARPIVDADGVHKNLAQLSHCCLTAPGTTGNYPKHFGATRTYLPPAGPLDEAWHQLVVEVSETVIRATFDGTPLTPVVKGREFRFDDIGSWASETLPTLVPTLAKGQVKVHPRGGMGLYLSGCRASFRNGWIEPFAAP